MTASSRAPGIPSGLTVALAVVAAITACAFRLATFNIGNDDYLHLVLGQQLLVGAVPIRDFLDPGELLFYSTSAAAQLLLGRTMLSEVLLDIAGFTIAYGLVFAAAARVSRSHLIGALMTAMAVLLFPRLYAYPKLLLYISGLWLAWRYADRPGTARVVVAAVATAIAFLFRHDHGAAVGITMLVTIVAVHRREGAAVVARRAGAFSLCGLLSISPFLVFIGLNGGVVHHFRVTLETARDEYRRTVNAFPTFRLDRSGVLPRPIPVYTRVEVRWAGTTGRGSTT